MARSDASHGRSRVRRFFRILISLVLVLVVAATASTIWGDAYDKYVDPRVDRWFEDEPAKPPPDPVTVAPPPALELPAVVLPPAPAAPVDSARLSAAEVRAALAPYLDDRELGPHVLAAVAAVRTPAAPAFVSGKGSRSRPPRPRS